MGLLRELSELGAAVPLREAAYFIGTDGVDTCLVEPASTAAIFALAVVQGLTEFLPVSSSGHLAIGREVLDVQEGGLALDVALHVGTLLAIVVAFRKDVIKLFTDLAKGEFRMWIWLIVATIPVGLIGVFGKDMIEEAAGTVRAAGVGLFVTATALMIGERFRKSREAQGTTVDHSAEVAPPLGLALFMGCAQAVAIWPGISRSGSTISAGFVKGLNSTEAARLSFLMSLPAISGAAIMELPDAFEVGFGSISPGVVLAAAAVAGLVGWAALKTLLLVLKKGSFPYFAAYCALLGTAALILGT
jgi:undecaprenyl-diphosphatase